MALLHRHESASDATRAWHRAGAGDHPRARPHRWLLVPLLVVALLASMIAGGAGWAVGQQATPAGTPLASPVASPVASPIRTSERPGPNIIVGHVTIEITDTGFVPSHFESAVGRDVSITVVNRGNGPHNFTLLAFDIDIDLAPGEDATVEILLPKLGEYPYTSSTPGDEDFSGTMVVFI